MPQESSPPRPYRLKEYLNWPLLGIILAWLVLITQVRHHWGGESYYNFGIFVPFLAVWLLLRNFAEVRPRPEARITGPLVLGALALLLVLPFHALSEVNPFWRLPLWIQAVGLVVFTMCALYPVYGRIGVLRAAFPVFFLCMMIPWPYRLELEVVQTLTHFVVGLSINILHFIGYPVELAGNSMVLGELRIGVNEACSGIRSLQALFMVCLFLGSLFGQGVIRRLAALLILPLIVIIVNAGRAVFLATQVIVNGDAAYERWHDPAGYIAFGISMVLIYACIELLNIGSKRSGQPLSVSADSLKELVRVPDLPASGIAYVLLPAFLFVVVEGWFQFKERTAVERPGWTFQPPDPGDSSVLYQDIHRQIEALLGYDYAHRFYFKSGGKVGEVYYYGYTEENRLSSVSSYGHSPTICMEATGATVKEQFPDLLVQLDDLALPLHHYLFELRGGDQRMHVFWIVWEKRNMDIDPEELSTLDYRTQWIQLLRGRRDFSRKVLLISLTSNEPAETARQRIRPLLEKWIQPGDSVNPAQPPPLG